jgi:hypothetical protein
MTAGPAIPMAGLGQLLAGAIAQPPPASLPSRPGPVLPQRAPLDTVAATPAATATLPWSPPEPAAPFQVTASLDGESPAEATPAELASLAELVGELIGEEPPREWLDLDNSDHLDRLTAKIYDRLSDRLRRDVLVQRERSGRLMDSW